MKESHILYMNNQYFKVYATLSHLKHSFDELKVVSVIGI